MAEYLRALPDAAVEAARFGTVHDVHIPLIVISSGDQTADVLDAHRALARLSSQGRHVVASHSTHWIPFDQPDLIVDAVRDIVERSHGGVMNCFGGSR
jgi:pimeloyl-ACP methyl ester carboxylesterase